LEVAAAEAAEVDGAGCDLDMLTRLTSAIASAGRVMPFATRSASKVAFWTDIRSIASLDADEKLEKLDILCRLAELK
jgi:hypothetical protein